MDPTSTSSQLWPLNTFCSNTHTHNHTKPQNRTQHVYLTFTVCFAQLFTGGNFSPNEAEHKAQQQTHESSENPPIHPTTTPPAWGCGASELTGALLTVRGGWCSTEDGQGTEQSGGRQQQLVQQQQHVPSWAALRSVYPQPENGLRFRLAPPARRDNTVCCVDRRNTALLLPPYDAQPTFSIPSLRLSLFQTLLAEPESGTAQSLLWNRTMAKRSTENSGIPWWEVLFFFFGVGGSLEEPIKR